MIKLGAELLAISASRFNDSVNLQARVEATPPAARGALRTTLKYVYFDDGPINLPRDRLRMAEQFLDPAELVLVRWMYTRTNGAGRAKFGANALRAARSNRYRCEHCGYSDVRALNIDHVSGRVKSTAFACLCANCHAIKSRSADWSGKTRRIETGDAIPDDDLGGSQDDPAEAALRSAETKPL